MARKALGKGLGALIPTNEASGAGAGADVLESPLDKRAAPATEGAPGVRTLRVEQIRANPWQPRSEVAEEALTELADSITKRGLLQPVVVRRADDGYELVAGERRFVACKMAGLGSVPAVVKEVNNREMLEIALVENIQREDLNPIDEARAYKRLREEFGLTQEEIAERVGKDRATVANQTRLLQLPAKIQEHVSRGTLSAGHGRALLALPDPGRQTELGMLVIDKGLSVRETERLAQKKHRAKRQTPKRALSVELAALEECLREHLATRVSIKPSGKGGVIEIHYYGSEELERLLEVMGAWRAPH
jgi:ParB family chromosome partitioning protein